VAVKDKGRKAINELAQKLERLEIAYVPIDSVKPNSYNANRQSDHDFELLLSSIRTDGFTQPVVVQKDVMEIVDGEHRWRAARELGYTEIPVVFVQMEEGQRMVSTLRHNRARGSEDIELTAGILRDLEQLGSIDWAQDELMLDDVELERLLHDVAAPEALAAEEFSQAWVPEGTHHSAEEGQFNRTIGGAAAIEGATAAASDSLRVAEKALAVAKTDEERQSAMKDRDVHRVALSFTGAEARDVREALGDKPAEELLRLCRIKLGKESA
jgi:ParB-like chromosome segregation protein Spo0J